MKQKNLVRNSDEYYTKQELIKSTVRTASQIVEEAADVLEDYDFYQEANVLRKTEESYKRYKVDILTAPDIGALYLMEEYIRMEHNNFNSKYIAFLKRFEKLMIVKILHLPMVLRI